LESFGAVSIEGPKYCGKTWAALNQANSVFYVMDPDGNYANKQLAELNPSAVITGDEPRLLDEWQVAPGLWDAVRFAVDRKAQKGRFILTGSTTPAKDKPEHSGTGRIAKVYLRPMTLFESGESSGSVSLQALFAGSKPEAAKAAGSIDDLVRVCVRGGWPENIDAPDSRAMRMPAQYLEAVKSSDISSPDNVPRNPRKVEALLRALARNNATMVSNTNLKWDISQGQGTISPPTLASYLAALKQIFVLEEVPGWAPNARAAARARTSPKRYLVDPSLVCAALGMGKERLLADMPTFGQVFEGLCMRDIQVYAWMMEAKLLHYHDDDGLEIDMILEKQDGSYMAVEVKLNPGHEDTAAASLQRFAKKMQAKGAQPPTCSVIVTGSGLAYTRTDGIVVVPITSLRD
jgi:predicted AAA+ superfamily ATPase